MAEGTGSAGMGALGWVGGGVAAVAIIVAAVYFSGSPDTEPVDTAQPEKTAGPEAGVSTTGKTENSSSSGAEPAAATSAETGSDSTSQTETASGTKVAEAEPAGDETLAQSSDKAPAGEPSEVESSEQAPALEAPQFDIVRVDNEGNTVIAGTGPAGARVTILLDGVEQATAEVDGTGAFVSLLSLPPSSAARVLNMVAELGDRSATAEDQIILAPAAQQLAEVTEPVPQAPAALQPPETDAGSGDATAATDATATPATVADAGSTASAGQMPASEKVASLGTAQEDVAPPAGDEDKGGVSQNTDQPDAGQAVEGTVSGEAGETDQAGQQAPAGTETTESAAQDPAATPQAGAETAVATAKSADQSGDEDTESDQTAVADAVVPTESGSVASAADGAATGAGKVGSGNASPEQSDVAAADPAGNTATAPETPAPNSEPAGSGALQSPASAGAVAVLRATPEGVEVLQPAAPVPEVQDQIALDVIGYSDDGEVQLSGRAQDGSVVRLYLDNRAVAEIAPVDGGQWSAQVPGIDPGVYTLRLDEVDSGGKVVSRLETPFKREAPEVLAPAQDPEWTAPDDTPLIRAVTVQKGDTLWAISRQRYGTGFLYVRVFEANRDNIRDPDLIYPGQVFNIPE